MRTNIVIPTEATHSSLDLFEKPPLLVTFDQSFEQKTGPLYPPTGSSLEFEIASSTYRKFIGGASGTFLDIAALCVGVTYGSSIY